jgi:hypothetical protein
MNKREEEVREVKEVENLVTAGGFNYIESEEGLKVRNSIVGRRLVEDDETFEEYKMRQKFARNFTDERTKGSWFWKSKKAPSKDLQTKIMNSDSDVLKSEEFLSHKGSNLGTYDKAKVEAFLKAIEDGGHK